MSQDREIVNRKEQQHNNLQQLRHNRQRHRRTLRVQSTLQAMQQLSQRCQQKKMQEAVRMDTVTNNTVDNTTSWDILVNTRAGNSRHHVVDKLFP